jgi:signal transduction histidine kinase
MRPPRSRVQFTKYLPWIVFVLAVVYLAIAWLWKRAFIWGDSLGPFWLFVAMDWTVLPLTIVSLLGFFTASAVWLVRLVRRESSAHSAALPSGLLLLASLVFLGACFPTLLSPITPLDSLTVRGRVYYLSGITALMDNNYALFECDGVGLMCQEVYRSGDYSPAEPMQAELAYDDATNTLSIEVGEHGTIHIYRP